MPTYEFRCANGHAFDEFHKISDAPQTATCPTCGAEAARAISGGAGLVFKGSGFYLTDYGKNAHRTSAPAGNGDGKSGGDKAGKGDAGDGGAKPADKPAAKTDGGSSSAAAPATATSGTSGGSGKTGGSSAGGAA